MNVWKIDSRWGDRGVSVLGLFVDYECVFFDDCNGAKIGDWASVAPEDFFLIYDGATPVALGKATGRFTVYRESGIHFTGREYHEFINEDVRLCPARIVLLPPQERALCQGGDPRKRFCRYNNAEVIRKLPMWWKKLSRKGEFQIIPRTASLFAGANCILTKNIKYRIPVFQRPYCWGESELRKLLERLRDAAGNNAPVFMGTMQLSQPIPLDPDGTKKAYRVIDGQQRLVTFMILCNVLEKQLSKPATPYLEDNLRTLVSNGEEQIKLDEYLDFIQDGDAYGDRAGNPFITNCRTMEALLEEYFQPNEAEGPACSKEKLYHFLMSDKIQFVVLETHAGLSEILQIFDTINTAGLALGATDLFKIRFYEYLKQQGAPDSVFYKISAIYADIEEYNRTANAPEALTMHDVLRTYQRIVAICADLPQNVFGKSYETFFEELFDTVSGIHPHPDFRRLGGGHAVLSIDVLKKIVECYKEYENLLAVDWHFRIVRGMIGETRYGNFWDLPIIARFYRRIGRDQIFEFTLQQLKLLCPPSLYYGRSIYGVHSALIQVMARLAQNGCDGVGLLRSCIREWQFDGRTLETMLAEACNFEIAFTPRWKYLVCRLVEYLCSEEKNKALFDRLWMPLDIEHIQCVTDENDPEHIRNEWGEELNRLGNLVLLESSINRSIHNHAGRKTQAYRESRFCSVAQLAEDVAHWQKADAENRRRDNTRKIMDFILS